MSDHYLHLQNMRRTIKGQLPPAAQFTAADATLIGQHSQLLLSWSDELVQGFYNTLYAHGPTSEIFQEGERPAREQTLAQWWQRVAAGPIDDQFWDWMTFVGLVHVVRKVKNPMMIGAWGFVEGEIGKRIKAALPADEAFALTEAFARFGKTFNALIAESYVIHYLEAVAESTGSSSVLLDRLVMTEIGTMLENVKPQFR